MAHAATFAALLLLQDGALEKPSVDEQSRSVSFAARVAKLDVHPELKGVVEYAIVMPGGKGYESLFIAAVDPVALREALVKVGAEPGAPADYDEDGNLAPPKGAKVRAFVAWAAEGKERREPLEAFVLDTETGKAKAVEDWVFTGSRMGVDPATGSPALQVTSTKNLISLHQADGTVLLQNPVLTQDGRRYKSNKPALPPEGTAVTVILQAGKE